MIGKTIMKQRMLKVTSGNSLTETGLKMAENDFGKRIYFIGN